MFMICELWTMILWYELDPWVCCAFGNILIGDKIDHFMDGFWGTTIISFWGRDY